MFQLPIYDKFLTYDRILPNCSGEVQQWDPSWKVVDKHSTGGVGDEITFPLVAAVATFGLKIPSITGRGLGHTGGTADKLESIPGFSIHLSRDELRRSLRDVGCYVTTTEVGNIAPADKVLYATRDITSTVCYAPLVCSSIMSKKLSGGPILNRIWCKRSDPLQSYYHVFELSIYHQY